MGYLTTLTIRNDGCDLLDPRKLTNEEKDEILLKIYYACLDVGRSDIPQSIGFKYYANLIEPQHARHADDHTIFVHYGNTVQNLNGWDLEFDNLAKNHIGYLARIINVADGCIKEAKEKFKKITGKTPKQYIVENL